MSRHSRNDASTCNETSELRPERRNEHTESGFQSLTRSNRGRKDSTRLYICELLASNRNGSGPSCFTRLAALIKSFRTFEAESGARRADIVVWDKPLMQNIIVAG
jgi:hypothetical protein